MKKFSLIAVTSLFVVALIFGLWMVNNVPKAQAINAQPTKKIVVRQNMLSSQKLQFMKKLQSSGLLKEFTFSDDKLTLNSPLSALQEKYHLSDAEIQMVQSMFKFDQQRRANSASSKHQNSADPQLSANGTIVYFTQNDMFAFLLTAASVGPEGMAVALTAVATLIGGPVGTAIGVILGIIGIASLSNFCYLVLQAKLDGTGVYMGIAWTPWPNYTQGEWRY